MPMKLRFFVFFLIFLCLGESYASKVVPPVIINFGVNKKVIYDLNIGTYSIVQGKKEILTNAFTSFKNHGIFISSKEYAQRVYKKTPVSDEFGKGIKHIISMEKKGLPTMKLTFCTHPKSEVIMLQLEIVGQNLESNYLVPMDARLINNGLEQDPRTLFVPFDNDTFIKYNAKKLTNGVENISSEVGAVYDDASRAGIIAGSIEHKIWKSAVEITQKKDKRRLKIWSGYTSKEVTRDQIEHASLTGNSIKSSKMFFGLFADWRTGLETYAKANRLAEPSIVFKWKEGTPVGWNSWGVLQGKINYENTTKVVDFFADSLKNFRNEGIAYIDLDSFWDNMIKGGYEGDYTQLKAFTDYCRRKGLKPGAYWAPFTDWGSGSGPNRRAEGSKYTFGEMWTKVGKGYHDFDGARALDPTHPGTRKRIDLVIKKLKEMGFKMIKIDFLGHAAVESTSFYDPKVKTGMQAYASGMEYLLKQLNGEMLVYAAISPNLASGRYVHMRRIACDAWKTIKDTQYTLNSVNYGWWQTYLYDYIDADHVVFAKESFGENKARLLSAVITGSLILGDDFSTNGPWNGTAKKLFSNPEFLKIVKNGKAFRPVDGNTEDKTNNLFIRKIGSYYYLAVFNFSKKDFDLGLDFKRLDIPLGKYQATEVFDQKKIDFNKDTKIHLDGENASLYKIGQVK